MYKAGFTWRDAGMESRAGFPVLSPGGDDGGWWMMVDGDDDCDDDGDDGG